MVKATFDDLPSALIQLSPTATSTEIYKAACVSFHQLHKSLVKLQARGVVEGLKSESGSMLEAMKCAFSQVVASNFNYKLLHELYTKRFGVNPVLT